jgi:transcriptional regulator with XRE-family HTH domain
MERRKLEPNPLAQKVKELRLGLPDRGLPAMTPAQLAEAIKVDPSSISRIEGGSREPELHTILAIANAFKLSPLDRNRLRVVAGYAPELSEAGWEPIYEDITQTLLLLQGDPKRQAEFRYLLYTISQHWGKTPRP